MMSFNSGESREGGVSTRRSNRNLVKKEQRTTHVHPAVQEPVPIDEEEITVAAAQISLSHPPITVLPKASSLTPKATGLQKRDLALLQQKQRLLRSSTLENLAILKEAHLRNALEATLVFAQSEAGTAFCISPSGLLLTCSHCVSEDVDELELNRIKWLLFASGRVVKAKCVKYDAKRDLAMLQVISAETEFQSSPVPSKSQLTSWTSFSSLSVSSRPAGKNAPMMCVGHPGSEDLETSRRGVKTGYDVLHVSYGKYRGVAKGADVQDNSEIGALMHDCWTYWGHSGAPLCLTKDGSLVGMHSSWDDETGMRRGVAWEAIVEFLEESDDIRSEHSACKESLSGSVNKPIMLD